MRKSKSPIKQEEGHSVWTQLSGDRYYITGVLVSGVRFKGFYVPTWSHASQINLFCGTKWLVRGGKHYVISRHYN